MGGIVVAAGLAGRRELPAEAFFTGMLSNALEPGEMVVELRYPRQPAGTGVAFVEFARRLGDFAITGAAAMLTMRDGVCERARLTIVGMGEGPFRVRAVEAMLTAQTLSHKACRAGNGRCRASMADDVHASSSYRRHLAGVSVRALNGAGAGGRARRWLRATNQSDREPGSTTRPCRPLSLADFLRDHLHPPASWLRARCAPARFASGRSALVPHTGGAGRRRRSSPSRTARGRRHDIPCSSTSSRTSRRNAAIARRECSSPRIELLRDIPNPAKHGNLWPLQRYQAIVDAFWQQPQLP